MVLTNLRPLKSAQLLTGTGKRNSFKLTAVSAHPDGEKIKEIETGLPELSGRSVVDPVQSGLLQEEPVTFEGDQSTEAAAEPVVEPLGHGVLPHETIPLDPWTGGPGSGDRGVNVNTIEDELLAKVCSERAEELLSVEQSIGAPVDKAANELAGAPEPEAPEALERSLSGGVVTIAVRLHQRSKGASVKPAEDLVEAIADPVATSPEAEQNPFALKDFEKKQSKPKARGAVDLRAQIGAIMERIDDLKSFDVTTITQRYDPKVRELRDAVNNTIADVFGRNTRDYWDYSLASFEAAHVVLGSPNRSSAELTRFYKAGIDKAITKLTTIAESLNSKIAKLGQEASSENKPVAVFTPDREEDVRSAERQERLPARVEPQSKVKKPTNRTAVEKLVESKVATSPEAEQNPFALKDFEKKQSKPKARGAVDLRAQIGAIMERIDDLKSFDVTTITQRYDPKVRELRDAVNNTIADVFGRNTRDYWDYSLASFEAAHVVLGSPNRSSAELTRFYKAGIDKAITKLTTIAESLNSKIAQSKVPDPSTKERRSARV